MEKEPIYLLASLLFLSLLLMSALLLPSEKITTETQLKIYKDNQKLTTSGKVVSQRPYGKIQLLKLDNTIELLCDSCPNLREKTITVEGILTTFNKPRIEVLTLKYNQ
ncbi:MAG TPA: hypothetical protein VJK51_04125 [Candidatus Nanoarchaeia archaeon]|nr:hypothetical protein [Candidatus Nanoarchaeia archaeon]